ncbi:hypothetical protein SAMD00023353_7400300 [Rosellinia necatrix]|uniref:Uncharacterized protein n=1 Tax=Rosellinia necatrix TaxID=77044 RepID=A0A1S8AAN2_ROSNE|nr:hypothetical protein SAMD00023353_7400300 [Rosellinia necatrix]
MEETRDYIRSRIRLLPSLRGSGTRRGDGNDAVCTARPSCGAVPQPDLTSRADGFCLNLQAPTYELMERR